MTQEQLIQKLVELRLVSSVAEARRLVYHGKAEFLIERHDPRREKVEK